MHDFWPLHRFGPRVQALHFSYAKAGLTIRDEPIPWLAETVTVEVYIRRVPAGLRKNDLQLQVENERYLPVGITHAQDGADLMHLVFRFQPPAQTVLAQLYFRKSSIGQITLPMVSQDQFIQNLRVQLPTAYTRVQNHYTACETFVSTQCQELLASTQLTSPTCLAPLQDLGLSAHFYSERTGETTVVPVPLVSSQLTRRQVLVNALLPRPSRRVGSWEICWRAGGKVPLARQEVISISLRQFHKSLYVMEGKFVLQASSGRVHLQNQLPSLHDDERVGPCFLLASREIGMAGQCALSVHPRSMQGKAMPAMFKDSVMVTDGPTVIAPGTLSTKELQQVSGFELRMKDQVIGYLSLLPAPAASFDGEGSFNSPQDYIWSSAAEHELKERMAKLVGDVD